MYLLRTFLTCMAIAKLAICSLIPVDYGAFTQTATYSIANQLGFFTANGLHVTYLQIPNSTYGYAQLFSGGYDILTGTADNAVSLRFNQNKTVTILGELDGGPDLAIASVPGIPDITQLRGKALMVDSATSGYAYVLRKVLGLYGLKLENGDYTFQVRLHERTFDDNATNLTRRLGRRLNEHPLPVPHSRRLAKRHRSLRNHPHLPFHR